jgi:uncharacterized OB-fold protein
MTNWPAAKLIKKPCRVCGDIMECTPRREVCSKCRQKAEKTGKQKRDKIKRAA